MGGLDRFLERAMIAADGVAEELRPERVPAERRSLHLAQQLQIRLLPLSELAHALLGGLRRQVQDVAHRMMRRVRPDGQRLRAKASELTKFG